MNQLKGGIILNFANIYNEYYIKIVNYYNLVKYKYLFTNHLSLQELIKIAENNNKRLII